MSTFYLPYQFVPVTGQVGKDPTQKVPWTDIVDSAKPQQARHDLWLAEGLSGRIVCRVTLKTPTLIGARQEKYKDLPRGRLPKIDPYERNKRPAIPANSLRGMFNAIIEAISQSSLRVLEERYWPFFEAIDPATVPLNPERPYLTPAETLLGAVDQLSEGDNGGRALASRLRFADALFLENKALFAIDEWKPLRTLGSPKPRDVPDGHLDNTPTPYFHPQNGSQGDCVIKNSISADRHRPNGRKFYLPHPNPAPPQWTQAQDKSKPKQDHLVRPLKEGQQFVFHADFDNLLPAEMDLLLTGITPGAGFLHRIGVGKSLGLGAIEVKIEAVFFIDRKSRYASTGFKGPRYQQLWHTEGHPPELPAIDRYREEQKALDSDAVVKKTQWTMPPFKSLVDPESLRKLCLIGAPDCSTPIRWRLGHKGEPAKPLPGIGNGTKLPAITTP